MRRLAASLLCLATAAAAEAGSVAITTEPIASFERVPTTDRFGPFTWRGGLKLVARDEDFGGFSGLAMGPDCGSLLAVSDQGHWLAARLVYEEGRLAGLTAGQLSPLRDSMGQPLRTKI